MGLKTIVLSIIIFSGLIYIPIYLVINHNLHVARTSYGIEKMAIDRLHKTKSSFEITKTEYKKYPDYNITIIAKNTGTYPLNTTKTILYLNGARYKDNISQHITDLKNPGLWDPGEYINITLNTKIRTQNPIDILLSSQYGVTREEKYYSQLSPIIFQSYIVPVDGNENTSIYNRSFSIYNPNDESINVWNITDEYSEDVLNILDSCEPSPCSIQGTRMLFSGNYSIAGENYLIFWYKINLNGTESGKIETKYYAHRTNKTDQVPFEVGKNKATAKITINGDIADSYYKGTNEFTIRISETIGKSSLSTSQYISIPIPGSLVSISTNDPDVIINSTHVTYKIQAPISLSSEEFSFTAELPDYNMPLIFNATLNGTDSSSNKHNDSAELLVVTIGEAPIIGTASVNDTSISVGQNVTFSQAITDYSGVQDVLFNISNNWVYATDNGDSYVYNLTCTSPTTFIWNATNASDIRGYMNSTKFEEINVTCT